MVLDAAIFESREVGGGGGGESMPEESRDFCFWMHTL